MTKFESMLKSWHVSHFVIRMDDTPFFFVVFACSYLNVIEVKRNLIPSEAIVTKSNLRLLSIQSETAKKNINFFFNVPKVYI